MDPSPFTGKVFLEKVGLDLGPERSQWVEIDFMGMPISQGKGIEVEDETWSVRTGGKISV